MNCNFLTASFPKIRKKCCGLPKLFHLVGALGSVWWWGGPPATLLLLWLLLLYSWRSGGKEKKERVGIFLSFPVFLHFHFGFSRILAAAAAASCWLHLTFISYQRRNISEIQMFFFCFVCYIVGRTARMTAGQNYWKCDTYNKSGAIVNVWIMKKSEHVSIGFFVLHIFYQTKIVWEIWISLKSSRPSSVFCQLFSPFISLFVVAANNSNSDVT